MITHRDHRPQIETRLDELGVPRQPRALILPGLLLPPGAERTLLPLRCPDCGQVDGWWFYAKDAVIVCNCTLEAFGK